jgi:hypothetical protein
LEGYAPGVESGHGHTDSPPFEPTRIFDHLWLGTIWTAKQLPVENQGIGMVLNWTNATTYRALSYLPTV